MRFGRVELGCATVEDIDWDLFEVHPGDRTQERKVSQTNETHRNGEDRDDAHVR